MKTMVCICMGVALFLPACRTTPHTADSKIAGAWEIVEGTERMTGQGRMVDRPLDFRGDEPYLVINPDGTFDTIHGSGMAAYDQLSHTGDRIEMNGIVMEVQKSRYTPDTSEVHWHWHDAESGQDQVISSEARLRPDGTLSFRYVKPSLQGFFQVETATLRRIPGHEFLNPPGLLREFKGHLGAVSSVAWSIDGRAILSGGWDRKVRLWDAESGRVIRMFEGHGVRVVHVSFLPPDGRLIVSGSSEPLTSNPADPYGIRVWDVANGRQVLGIKPFKYITGMDISPDGRWAAVNGLPEDEEFDYRESQTKGREALQIWNLKTGELHTTLRHPSMLNDVLFLREGHSVLTIGLRVSGHSEKVREMLRRQFDADLFETEGILCIYRLDGDARPHHCFGEPASRDTVSGPKLLSLSPAGGRVLTIGYSNVVLEHDLESGQELQRCELEDTHHAARAVYLPSGRQVVIGDDRGNIRIWDLDLVGEQFRFKAHRDGVTDLAVSPNGRVLLSASVDGGIRLWELPASGR